jgi:hypothetical protein
MPPTKTNEVAPADAAGDSASTRKRRRVPSRAANWMRVDHAARVLDVNVITLRRAIERHARRDAEGRVHAAFDGVRARKLGRHWRILLDSCWSVGPSA